MSAGKTIIALFLGLLLASYNSVAFARVTAEVDRSEIAMGETLRLTLRGDAGERPDSIDIDALRTDFEILQRSSSTSARVIGGEQSVTRTLEIELSPLREGIATIPAFEAGGRRTTPIAIKVNKQPEQQLEGELVYFDAKVDSNEVYVQAQVILTITLQQAINLDNRAISELDIPDAYQEPLEQRNFQRRAAGRLWQVTELRYAVFPQKSGALQIPAIAFSGRELLPGRSLLGARLGRRVSIKSDPISITVKPAPADFPGDIWLPAKSLDFSGTWSSPPGQLTVGDSTTRTLRISAEGLQGSQLPPINSFGGASGPDGLRFYPDQETIDQREISNGLQGFRNQSEALVTSTAGSWSLPELVIPWWNTETDSLEYARLPAEQVVVKAPGIASAPDTTPGLDPAAADVGVTDRLIFWQGLAGTGWVLLLITGWLAWSRRTQPGAGGRDRKPQRNTRELVSLKKACAENDALAARSAVLRWAKTQGPGDSGNGLEQIAARHDPDLAGELRALDKALFSKEAGAAWRGERLFKLIRKIEDRTEADGDEVLQLYPST